MSVDARIERVARAMCAADGRAPDAEVSGPSNAFVVQRHRGGPGSGTEFYGPCWETYARKARLFIAAYEALISGN